MMTICPINMDWTGIPLVGKGMVDGPDSLPSECRLY